MKHTKARIVPVAPNIELTEVGDTEQLPDRLMRLHTLAAYLDAEYRYVKEVLVKRPGFPKPHRLAKGGVPRWRKSEIDATLELWRDEDV